MNDVKAIGDELELICCEPLVNRVSGALDGVVVVTVCKEAGIVDWDIEDCDGLVTEAAVVLNDVPNEELTDGEDETVTAVCDAAEFEDIELELIEGIETAVSDVVYPDSVTEEIIVSDDFKPDEVVDTVVAEEAQAEVTISTGCDIVVESLLVDRAEVVVCDVDVVDSTAPIVEVLIVVAPASVVCVVLDSELVDSLVEREAVVDSNTVVCDDVGMEEADECSPVEISDELLGFVDEERLRID